MAIFALVDCNNFFASCERVFRPELTHKPVVVLSNNDGCVIARSNEAKALNIKMGVPAFKIKELIEQKHVNVFSSNYTLYGDMSARVMSVLGECVPEIEIYSIDEAFLLMDGYTNLMGYTKAIKAKVFKWTGLPVSIGVGPSKTIAKLANYVAKKHMRSGVFSFLDPLLRERAYKQIPIGEVWGVGRRLTKQLQTMNIFTVEDFVNLDSALVRKKFNVTLLKTQMELQGESCLSLEDMDIEQKSINSSRSFGKNVTSLDDLKASITLHVSKVAHKLRYKKMAVSQLYVYAYNNRFSKTERQRQFSCLVELPCPTNSTTPLLEVAIKGIESVYEEGVIYKKAGVYAPVLLPEGTCAEDLFTAAEDPKYHTLSTIMDQINSKFGRDQIFHGSLGMNRDWLPKNLLCSPRYTTEYNELLCVS